VFAVHQNHRWDEDYLTAKKIYDDHLLGQIFRIESPVHGSREIPGDCCALPEHGGGMVLDWGVHILDQALQMIPGKVKEMYATFTYVTNELVDDSLPVELTFDNELVFMVKVGTSHFIPLPRWYLLGCDDTALIENFSTEEKLPAVHSDIRDFCKNILTTVSEETPLLVSLESVMRSLKLMEAIFESAKQGMPVPFE
jgi:predicted dehydrogenase